MSFIPQNKYTKQELVDCGNGNLFTNEGDGRLPSDQMLMFDEISNIDGVDVVLGASEKFKLLLE